MKKLQNNFTTPEQSQRLLELGVPVDSADCYYSNNGIRKLRSECWMLKPNFFVEYFYNTPCWSAGRLMEIYCTCRECKWEYITNNPPIEDILCDIELYIEELDFSKLN